MDLRSVAETSQSKALLVQLQRQFRRAGHFTLAESGPQGAYHVKVSTLDADGAQGGITVYSVVLTMTDIGAMVHDPNTTLEHYLSSTVGYCSNQAVENCAKAIYGTFGPYIEESNQALGKALREAGPSGRRTTASE